MYDPTLSIDDGHRHGHVKPAAVAHGLTRRRLLTASAAFTGAGLSAAVMPAFGQQPTARPTVRPTAEQVIGPFYPVRLPPDQDADLTVIAGKEARALGTIVYLSGRVTNVRGEPVANADLEIWQANAAGRYTHAADDNPQPIDPNFDGYARVRADAEGRYRIKTIKPGAYPVTPVAGWLRPPHIHFDVRGQASRLVTQMYFEGEELNTKDRFFDRLSPGGRDGLLARYGARSDEHEPNALIAVWNIVLMAG